MIYAILLVILSYLSYIVAGALFLGIVALTIRHDLVSAAIAKELRRQQQPTTAAVAIAADDDVDDWTDIARRLAFEPVPPAVRIQMLINRVQKCTTDRLHPLEKRFKKVNVRLTKIIATCRRARMAYDFEWSEVNALCESNSRQTMSIGTNTDNAEISGISRSAIVKEQSEPSATASSVVSGVEPSTQSMSPYDAKSQSLSPDAMKSQSRSIPSVNPTQSELISISTISAVPPIQEESLNDAFKELVPYLISIVLWFKNALTSDAYRRKAIKVYKTLNSILHSEYLKQCFKFAFESFDNLVRLYTHINTENDVTWVMIRIPATEND